MELNFSTWETLSREEEEITPNIHICTHIHVDGWDEMDTTAHMRSKNNTDSESSSPGKRISVI